MSIPASLKKLKNSEETKEVLHNYSSLLSSCFYQESNLLNSFLYSFKSFPDFGILLPIDFQTCIHLEFLENSLIEIDSLTKLRKFQHELWSDLLKTSKDPVGRVSEANYFIVPLKYKKIDWNLIAKAINEEPFAKLQEIPNEKRPGLLLRTFLKGPVLWKYLFELRPDHSISHFFDCLFMSDLVKSKENKEKFSGYEPIDVIFDERFSNPALKDFRNLIVSGAICEFDESSELIFVRQVKTIRTNDSEVLNKNTKGVPLLPSQNFEVFYLNFQQWEQARGVFNVLIETEEFSWVLEFFQKFSIRGNPLLIKAAMTCYNEKTRKIFENLEILGGVTCNLIIGILVFLEETVKFEGKNVEKIVKALLGVENCEKVAKKFDLFYFLKTSCIKPTCFRPAFYASKESITECYNLEHRISEGLAAGFIKALVAGLLVSNGLKDSAELLVKFGILKENQFRIVEKYLNDDSLFLVNCKKISSLSIIPKFSEIFYGVQKNTVENILDYQFNDQTLLEKSECLDLFNQKIVKFLGKAIIDFIVSYNFLTFLDLETSLFLFLFQEARSSYNISRITLSSGLFKFINLETDKKLNLENIFQEKSWDDHLFKTSSPLPVCLENFFYNLSVAILKDSEDLSMTCQLIGFFFNDFISVSLRYKNRLKKALNSKITEILKNTSVKVEYKEIENSSGACVKVFINKELVCESTGRNIKQAKVEACLNVFQFICMCNLIHYNKPLIVMD